jgi:hypothetical protein
MAQQELVAEAETTRLDAREGDRKRNLEVKG